MPFLTDAMISSGGLVAAEHICVGHARHRCMRVGFAPSVAGWLHSHQARVLPILHVADKNAVIDQHSLVGRHALVIDSQ